MYGWALYMRSIGFAHKTLVSWELLDEFPGNRTIHNALALSGRFPELEMYVIYADDGSIAWLTLFDPSTGHGVELHGILAEGHTLVLSKQIAEAFDDILVDWFSEGKPQGLAQRLHTTYRAIRQEELRC